jgi:hypothetical protein
MTEIKKETQDDDSVFLSANENLLAAKAYILFSCDQKGEWACNCDLRKLNSMELNGMIKVASEQLAMMDVELRCGNQDGD